MSEPAVAATSPCPCVQVFSSLFPAAVRRRRNNQRLCMWQHKSGCYCSNRSITKCHRNWQWNSRQCSPGPAAQWTPCPSADALLQGCVRCWV